MSLLNTIFSNPAFCDFGGPTYLLFSSNVPHLVYYSHIPITIISLFLGFFVFFKNRKGLPNRILFCLTLAFSAWVFLDSIFWASNRSDVIMFVWSLQILFEPIVYIGALYLLYVLVNKNDISFTKKLLIATIYMPVIIFAPTAWNLSAFNTQTCLSEEGPIAIFYTYSAEILYTFWIIVLAIRSFLKANTREMKREIVYITVGILLLLFAFSFGNIISSFTENWRFAQIGLFAMPIFLCFLAYNIVKYNIFNIKLLATQALVVGIWFLIGAQFAFIRTPINRILNSITFIGVIIAGNFLVHSVKREVEQRERLQKLSEELSSANSKLQLADRMKSQFLSFASHQVKSPMTVVKGYAELIMDGSFGAVPDKVKETAEKIKESSDRLIALVNNLLDLRKLEEGKIEYKFDVMDINDMTKK